jgi:hypothetical protein
MLLRPKDLVGLELVELTLGVEALFTYDPDCEAHVLRFERSVEGVWAAWSCSFFDLRRNGELEKNPDRFFWTAFTGEALLIPAIFTPLTGGMPFVGEFFPETGSALV